MPAPANPRYSVVQYLLAEKEHIALLNKLLQDSAQELMEQIVANAAKTGVTAALTNVQMRAQLASILDYQKQLWAGIEDITRTGQSAAAYAASKTVSRYEADLLKLVMSPATLADLTEAEAQRAAAGVQSAISRILSSEMPLSDRVYYARQLSNNQISDLINKSLAAGDNARQLALKVRDFIRPEVPGGASYSARRLARTEINNAYHATTVKRYQDSKIVEEVDWVLSSSHPEGDECDTLAADGPYDVENVPKKPHPQCFCGIQPHLPEPDEFLKKMFKGDYGDSPWSGAVDNDVAKQSAAESGLSKATKAKIAKTSSTPGLDKLPKLPGGKTSLTAGGQTIHGQSFVNPHRYETAAKGKLVMNEQTGLYEKATKAQVNATGKYSINCTRTSATVELRARGFNVMAGAKPGVVNDNYNGFIERMWKDKTGAVRTFRTVNKVKGLSAAEEATRLMTEEGPGARFFVIGIWKGGHSSHIWNAEVGPDGVLRHFDGQVKSNPDRYFEAVSPTNPVFVLRVDDLYPTDALVERKLRWAGKREVLDEPWILPYRP